MRSEELGFRERLMGGGVGGRTCQRKGIATESTERNVLSGMLPEGGKRPEVFSSFSFSVDG